MKRGAPARAPLFLGGQSSVRSYVQRVADSGQIIIRVVFDLNPAAFFKSVYVYPGAEHELELVLEGCYLR